MGKIKNEIAVGLLFFSALIILAYFTIISNKNLFSRKEYYYMQVVFENVIGLGNSNRIKVNGVESGIVNKVKLMEDNNVMVTLKMHNEFQMYSNYEIRIMNETALGGKYIGIDPGSPAEDGIKYAIIDKTEILSGKSSADLFGELTDMIAENRDSIKRSIDNFEEITAKINDGTGTIGKLVNENEVHDNTDDLITEVRQTLEDTREQAPITSFIKAALGFL